MDYSILRLNTLKTETTKDRSKLMSLTKITQADLTNKGVVGLADTPNLSTVEMQEKFDEIALDVIVPKFNELSGELDDYTLDEVLHSEDVTDVRLDEDGRLQISTDNGETWSYAGSTGHLIMNGSGTTYPARARLQFSQNVVITDDEENNKTFLSIAGQKGDKGDAATIHVGTVESGEVPEITNTGTSTDAIFNFTLPKGDDGYAATIQVGTVTSGDEVSVSNRGTSSAAIFDFTLPKGEKGDPGTGLTLLDSYATLAQLQAAHPTGQRGDAYLVGDASDSVVYLWSTTNNTWVNVGSLKGAKGDTGSAATISIGTVTESNSMSVENVGTSTNAVLNFGLKKGDKGDQGNAGTISIGTVQSGSTPAVVNVGTPSAAVLNFVLPQGEKGDKGDPTTVNGKSDANVTLYGSDIYEDDDEDSKTLNELIGDNASDISALDTQLGLVEGDVSDLETLVGDASDLPTPTDTVCENIEQLNINLTANSNPFIFDYHDGKYGFNTSESRGADTFIPFKSGYIPLKFTGSQQSPQYSPSEREFNLTVTQASDDIVEFTSPNKFTVKADTKVFMYLKATLTGSQTRQASMKKNGTVIQTIDVNTANPTHIYEFTFAQGDEISFYALMAEVSSQTETFNECVWCFYPV